MKKILFPAIILIFFGFFFSQDARADTVTLIPNAPGDVTQQRFTGCAANWECVVSADDWTSYVSSIGDGYKYDLYNLPDQSLSGIINSVTVYIRVWGPGVWSDPVTATYIKTNGVEYFSTKPQTSVWTTYSTQYKFYPQTLRRWTWAEINYLQAGVMTSSITTPVDEDFVTEYSYATQVYVVVDYMPPAPGANWLSGGYNYRKQMAIQGTTAVAQTNYQMKLTVFKGAGTDSGLNVYLNSHAASWPNDIRFTNSSGDTLLDYWVESSDANQATVWVEFDSIPALPGTAYFYVYYGNASAVSASSYDNTMAKDYGESGLVGLWHMDEGVNNTCSGGQDACDSSGQGNHGTFKADGEPSWVGSDGGNWDNKSPAQQFSSGSSLYFDGIDDYIKAGDANLPAGASPRTVEFWVSRSSAANFTYYPYLFFYGTKLTYQGFGLYGNINTTDIWFYGHGYDFDTGIDLNDNNWHHIAIAFDGTNVRSYKDGLESSGSPVARPSLNTVLSTNDFTIGGFYVANQYFGGSIDEARVYNRALSLEEIKAHYERRKYASPGPSPGSWGGEETNIVGWLAGYNYRKKMTILGTAAGAQINYPMKLTINGGSGADSGSSVYLNDKALNWPNDIRFTKSNGTTSLDYWLESSSTDQASIWVEFDSIPALPGTANFYIYYGKNTDVSASNGDNTFLFFDDFPGISLDGSKWTAEGSPIVNVNNSILTLTSPGDAWRGIRSIQSFGPYNLRWRAKAKGAGTNGEIHQMASVLQGWTGDMAGIAQGTAASGYTRTANNGSYTTTDPAGFDPTNYHTLQMLFKSGQTTFWLGDVLKQTHIANIPDQALYLYETIYSSLGATYVDWVFLGKWADAEPIFWLWGAQEFGGASYTLTVSKSGAGSGTVTSDPAGIDCGVDCAEGYESGRVVTLTATAAGGSIFTGWSVAGCSGTGACAVTMDAVKSVTANFDIFSTCTYVSFSSCASSKITANLNWNALTQADVNAARSDCTLSSATYSVEITGLGSASAGSLTSYSWPNLNPSTSYNWRITSSYQCTDPINSGSFQSDFYLFTTPSCNAPPNQPSTFETNWNRCAFKGSAVPTLSWTYYDPNDSPPGTDPQSAYEIEVDENASFLAPKFNHKVNSPSASYVLDLREDDENPDDLPSSMQDYQLDWNATYFWRVKVWDSFGNESPWSNSSQSKTDKHASPWVEFTWAPPEPAKGETVEFYSSGTKTFGGALTYLWTILPGGIGTFVDDTTPADPNPHIQFATRNNTIRLEVTDEDLYSCYTDMDVEIQLPLPEYKEVPPIIWFRKMFNGLLAFFDGF